MRIAVCVATLVVDDGTWSNDRAIHPNLDIAWRSRRHALVTLQIHDEVVALQPLSRGNERIQRAGDFHIPNLQDHCVRCPRISARAEDREEQETVRRGDMTFRRNRAALRSECAVMHQKIRRLPTWLDKEGVNARPLGFGVLSLYGAHEQHRGARD
jgi:hypothetical protein